jgi:peptidyl-lysine (3S)-dioxygenase / protease
MHRDNYENIYVQVLGQKHFVLLPPLCQPCVNEQPLAQYNYTRSGSGLTLVPEEQNETRQDGGEGDNTVPFAVWDPDAPGANTTPYSSLAEPMRVTLNPGDMLYLPAMWYHKVSQSASDEGICVAVNYWYVLYRLRPQSVQTTDHRIRYDMDFTGPLLPLVSFVKLVYQSKK